MKRSNRLVILVGVLLAVLAFVAIVILLNNRDDEVPPEQQQLSTVLVATEDIDIGEEVTPDKVEAVEVQPAAVQETPLSDPSQVAGQPAVFAVPSGSQLTAEAIGLGNPLLVNIQALLNPGEKAVSFQVERVGGMDFLIKPGDTIDVVVTNEVTVLQETADSAANTDADAAPRFEPIVGLENQRTVKAILQDKRVIYVSATRAVAQEPEDTNNDGVVDEQDEQAAQVIESVVIVFAGTAQDAELMRFAQRDVNENGSLSVVVRHPEDDEVEETLGITIDQMVDEFGLRIPGIVEQLNEEQPAP